MTRRRKSAQRNAFPARCRKAVYLWGLPVSGELEDGRRRVDLQGFQALGRLGRRVGDLPDGAVRAQQLRELNAPQAVGDVAPGVAAGVLSFQSSKDWAFSVIEQLDAHDRVLVSSFSERRRLATLELLSRPVATSAGSRKVVASYISAISGLPWLVERLLGDVDALQLPTKMRGLNFTNPRFIEAVIRAKCEIHYWTINDSIEMNQLIQMGATGIVTDRSDLLGVS